MSITEPDRVVKVDFRVWKLLVIVKLSLSWADLCWVSTNSKGFRQTYFFACGRVTAPAERKTRHIRPWFMFAGPLAVKLAWITPAPDFLEKMRAEELSKPLP